MLLPLPRLTAIVLTCWPKEAEALGVKETQILPVAVLNLFPGKHPALVVLAAGKVTRAVDGAEELLFASLFDDELDGVVTGSGVEAGAL